MRGVAGPVTSKVLNDAARFLAGLPGGPQSQYHEAESTPAWAQYSKGFDDTWATAEKEQFAAVNAFEARELKPSASGNSFLFYPFSGPDVLYATQFFPRSTLTRIQSIPVIPSGVEGPNPWRDSSTLSGTLLSPAAAAA